MEIKDLIPVSWANQPVLVSKQLAEVYGTTGKSISMNFSRAKEYFKEGEHYFKLTGDALRQFKRYSSKIGMPIHPYAAWVYLWTYQGCALHCKMLNKPDALDVLEELRRNYFEAEPPKVVEIKGVRCYVDAKGDAFINADDAAKGLGFIDVHFAKSGERWETARWARINGYLRDLGCLKEGDADLKTGDYIGEVWFYLLAMKASNETARKFQWKVAAEIMPSLRKYGYYATAAAPAVATFEEEVIRLRKQIEQSTCAEFAVVYALLMSNGTVKIGMTKDLTERVKKIKAESGLYVLKFASTPFMVREEAVAVEAALKEKFAADCIGGEFFDVKFCSRP